MVPKSRLCGVKHDALKVREVRIVGLLGQGRALDNAVRGKECIEVPIELINSRFSKSMRRFG